VESDFDLRRIFLAGQVEDRLILRKIEGDLSGQGGFADAGRPG